MKFLMYERINGKILSIGTTPDKIPLVAPEHNWCETKTLQKWNYSEYLFNLKTKTIELKFEVPYIINKDEMIADGTDTIIINLPKIEPNGTKILFQVFHYLDNKWQDSYEMTDNIIEFTTIKPGIHKFELKGINYYKTIIEIEAYED